jgi:hypothetical protein
MFYYAARKAPPDMPGPRRDHILFVATDGYLERGVAAKAKAEAAKPKASSGQ